MADEVRVRDRRATPTSSPARAEGRALAARLGFSRTDATLIATAISEVARNIVVHAGWGEIVISRSDEPDQRGLVVVARDDGPGIRDVEAALEGRLRARGGLGLGLPGRGGSWTSSTIDAAAAAPRSP